MNRSDEYTPGSELERRIGDFQQHLVKNEIDGALIIQKTDLYYFSGTIQQAHLYIPAKGEALLMAFKDYERARTESGLRRIVPLGSPKKLPEILGENGIEPPSVMGMELDVLPVNLYNYYQSIFKEARISDISHPVRLVRSVKSDYETGLIRDAAACSDMIAEYAKEAIREGLTEIEVAGMVEAYARKLGHQGIVRMRLWGNELFYGHLMSGPTAAVPSYLSSPTGGHGPNPAVAQGPGFRKIERGEPVLVDYVFALNGYLSDMTRLYSIGEPASELMEAQEAVLEIQEAIKAAAKPGTPAGEVYETAVASAEKLGYADHFMGHGKTRISFVGHGVGLELDEYPFLAKGQKLPLEEGMIIAIEPKLVFPGKGVVGVENTCVLEKGGLVSLGTFNEGITIL